MEGGGGRKSWKMLDSTGKQTSAIAQFQVQQSLRSGGGGIPQEARSDLPLPTSEPRNGRKKPKSSEERAAERVPVGGAEKRPVPPENATSKASQRHIKGNSEGRRRGGGGGRRGGWGGGTGNLPSIQELSAQIQLLGGSCPSNPLRSRPHGASTYGPFRLKSVCGEKNALETREGGAALSSLLLFSSLRSQAAMQLCGSLLQATPAPTEPTGWSSSALQSQEPTAGS